MKICYFVVRGIHQKDAGSIEFYETSPAVRKLYDDVETWTGLKAETVLSEDLPAGERDARNVMAVRAVASQVGVYDVLAELGLRPAAVVGLSLGITTAACMAGALGRRDTFQMMRFRQGLIEVPPNTAEQGVAWCIVPPGRDPDSFHVPYEGVYLGVDFGEMVDGSGRSMVLSGYKAALEKLAAQEPDAVKMMPGTSAPHSPLRQYWADLLREHVSNLEFHDPEVPLIACLEQPATLTTGEQVREAIWRNGTRTASVAGALGEMKRHGMDLCIVVGPSMDERVIKFPVPTVYVKEPADVPKVEDKVRELGGVTA